MPDSIGTKDEMVVVVSKQPLDWYKLNQTFSRQPQTDYATRVNNALRPQTTSRIRYQGTPSGSIRFESDATNDEVAVCVVEISKQ